jgi:uncharacterized membrane protein YqhA
MAQHTSGPDAAVRDAPRGGTRDDGTPPPDAREARRTPALPVSRFTEIIGRSRFIVLLAVVAVMLIAVSLFLLGTLQAVVGVWHAWEGVVRGEYGSVQLTVEFLEIVSVMLKAVVFYIIGVGLYSLFVAPLNITVSLGVQTLSDLESKVVSVVVVILGVTFLEHFILWERPLETLQHGAALSVVVIALVVFQHYAHRAKEDQQSHNPDEQARAQHALFEQEEEQHAVEPERIRGVVDRGEDGRGAEDARGGAPARA